MFLASLIFESEIVRTVEERIGPKVMFVNYFIAEVLCSHHLLFIDRMKCSFIRFHPSNLNVFFSPVFESFFAFDFIGIVVLLI